MCPPCTLFSSLQNICPNGLPEVRCPDKCNSALVMLRFALELRLLQHKAGRSIVFEHPSTATSREDQSLRKLVSTSGVLVSLMDMCRYEMVASDKLGEAPVRKITQIATNVPEISDALSARCEGGRRHVHLVAGRPKHAAIYPPEFCKAVVKGLEVYKQRRAAGITFSGNLGTSEKQRTDVGSLLNFSRADLCDPDEELGGRYVDDLKGTELDPKLTSAAREEELDSFRN